MKLIKSIKKFINGIWEEFSFPETSLDNVVMTEGNQNIKGVKTFMPDGDGSNFMRFSNNADDSPGLTICSNVMNHINLYDSELTLSPSAGLNKTKFKYNEIHINGYNSITSTSFETKLEFPEGKNGIIALVSDIPIAATEAEILAIFE